MEKSIFNFKIEYLDGTVLDLHEDKNLWVSSFRISSPEPEHITSTIEGQHGSNYQGTILKDRKIVSSISVEAWDDIDFDMKRDEIFKIFNPLKQFYIIRDLQRGKRIKVSVSNSFDIDYITLEDGEFSIEFVIHSVFLESVGSTEDPFTFEAGKWQIGQGLIDAELKYTHDTTTFRIFNAGDIEIDPRSWYLPLKIIFKGVSNGLSITNQTTGDYWKYNGTTSSGDTIILDRVKAEKNGVSIFNETNGKVIKLAEGWNDFVVSGIDSAFTIQMIFRFYYL